MSPLLHFTGGQVSGNLYAQLPEVMSQEVFEELAKGESFRLERIVSLGHITAYGEWYDQDVDEWVMLLAGAAKLVFADEEEHRSLKPGDWLLIPAHRRHRVEWTDPTCYTMAQ